MTSKKQCEELFNELGPDLATAINVFLSKSLHAGGFPFIVSEELLNEEMIATMEEEPRIGGESKFMNLIDRLLNS